MNIFILDNDPELAAQYHLDRHVVKQVLETAQLLCIAAVETGGKAPYKVTHKNHPCAVWARQTKANFNWLRKFGLALADEYTYRYGKTHKSAEVIRKVSDETIPDGPLTNFAQAVPDQYKGPDPVEAYRKYYITDKIGMAMWTRRLPPDWFPGAEKFYKKGRNVGHKPSRTRTKLRKRNVIKS